MRVESSVSERTDWGCSPRPLFVLALLALALAACSPEATRTRGGGPGADVGNHGSPIQLHGRSDPAFREPIVGQAARR